MWLLIACPRDLGPPSQMVVHAGEDQVWPPASPECAPVVACCDALAALDRSMAVACPIAAAARKSCAEIGASAVQIFHERSKKPLPEVCKGFAPAPQPVR